MIGTVCTYWGSLLKSNIRYRSVFMHSPIAIHVLEFGFGITSVEWMCKVREISPSIALNTFIKNVEHIDSCYREAFSTGL